MIRRHPSLIMVALTQVVIALTGCMGSESSDLRADVSPTLVLSEGSAVLTLMSAGTLAVWVELDSTVVTRDGNGLWTARILTHIEGPATAPYFKSAFEELPNGSLLPRNPGIHELSEGAYAVSHRSSFSVESPNARLLVVFGSPQPGPWRILIGDPGPVAPNQEDGWALPTPSEAFRAPTALAPPEFSTYGSDGPGRNVTVNDSRERLVAGGFTAGALTLSASHLMTNGISMLNVLSAHEGAGNWELAFNARVNEARDGVYANESSRIAIQALRDAHEGATFDLAFRPVWDARTLVHIEMMTVPLPPPVPRVLPYGTL